MYGAETVREVFHLHEDGLSKAAVARRTGVSRTQVRFWLAADVSTILGSSMRAESPLHKDGWCSTREGLDASEYAYLLGQFLGDGCISRQRRTWRLRISCCDAYPGIRREVEAALSAIRPNTVGAMQRQGCTEVGSYSSHWPCLFPQHGPGKKHERRIELETWQRAIALDGRPDRLVRGLLHSDGCRVSNKIVGRRGQTYTYPRYLFVNESPDILAIFAEACARLRVACRPNRRNSLSVARRADVDVLDSIVGPKR